MTDSLQVKHLTEKIELLQLRFDSIANNETLRQLEFRINEKQEVISQINDFYDSAWLKLLFVISLIGVAIPMISQYFQKLNLKELASIIQKQTEDNFSVKLEQLEKSNKTEYDNKLRELEQSNKEDIKKSLDSLNAKIRISHLNAEGSLFAAQAGRCYAGGDFNQACESSMVACEYYLEIGQKERAITNIENVIKSINAFERDENEKPTNKDIREKLHTSINKFISKSKTHKKYHLIKDHVESLEGIMAEHQKE